MPGSSLEKVCVESDDVNLDKLAAIVSELMDINTSLLLAPGKERKRVAAQKV